MEFGSRRGPPHPELAQHLELAMWVFGPKWQADCGAACGVLGDDLISFASGNQQALQELSERTAAIESQAPP